MLKIKYIFIEGLKSIEFLKKWKTSSPPTISEKNDLPPRKKNPNNDGYDRITKKNRIEKTFFLN